jgi:hypothetical protein
MNETDWTQRYRIAINEHPTDMVSEFLNCEVILCQEIEREVIEGEFPTGLAFVDQFIARKTS